MDTGRDLACPALWQESLERSLARRGRPTRSSLELFHLRPERDLSRPDLLRESLMVSQLRRSAVNQRPSMALPGAGGISALALLAAATLPGLLGGRPGGRERVAYRADATDARTADTAVDGLMIDPSLVARATAGLAGTSAATAAPAASHMLAAEPRPTAPARQLAHPAPASAAAVGPANITVHASAPRHIALAHDAVAHVSRHTVAHTSRHNLARHARHSTTHDLSHNVAHALSGGAAPAAPRTSVSAPRVPAEPQPIGHPSTGGGAIGGASHTPATHRVTATHPVTASHPVTSTHPVSTAKPAPTAPAPAPPPPATGRYVNPLAAARVSPERIDQGVDYSGSGTLGAIGDGKVTYVGTSGTGWPGAFVEYQLTSGPDAGRYVYYAESISPAGGLHVGETVHAGQPIASINGGIEVGWGSGVGTQPAAQADGHWSSGSDAGNVATPDGKSFSALIAQLGGPAGKIEG